MTVRTGTVRLVAVLTASVLFASACGATPEPAGSNPTPATTSTTTTTVPRQPASTQPAGLPPTTLAKPAPASLLRSVVGDGIEIDDVDLAAIEALAGTVVWTDPTDPTYLWVKDFVVAADGSYRVEAAGAREEVAAYDASSLQFTYWVDGAYGVTEGLPPLVRDGAWGWDFLFGCCDVDLGAVTFLDAEPVEMAGRAVLRVVTPAPDPEELDDAEGVEPGPTTVLYHSPTGIPLLVDGPNRHIEVTALRALSAVDRSWFVLEVPPDAAAGATDRGWRRSDLADVADMVPTGESPLPLQDVFVSADGAWVAVYRSGLAHIAVAWYPNEAAKGLDPYDWNRPMPPPGTVELVVEPAVPRLLDRRSDGVYLVTGTSKAAVMAAGETLRP